MKFTMSLHNTYLVFGRTTLSLFFFSFPFYFGCPIVSSMSAEIKNILSSSFIRIILVALRLVQESVVTKMGQNLREDHKHIKSQILVNVNLQSLYRTI